MCVPDVFLTATFLAVKEMMIYMCVPDVLVTDAFLTVKEISPFPNKLCGIFALLSFSGSHHLKKDKEQYAPCL